VSYEAKSTSGNEADRNQGAMSEVAVKTADLNRGDLVDCILSVRVDAVVERCLYRAGVLELVLLGSVVTLCRVAGQ
jgi:hypothetical protein